MEVEPAGTSADDVQGSNSCSSGVDPLALSAQPVASMSWHGTSMATVRA